MNNDAKTAKVGTHGFNPTTLNRVEKEGLFGQVTFSVGIFEWAAGRSRPHRNAASIRVIGGGDDVATVRATCERIVRELDAGIYQGPRNVRVGSLA